jgi:phage protein D
MARKFTPIFKDQDFYVPHFQIKLQRQALDPEVVHDILRVTYKDSLTDIDSFEITINNWDEEYRTYEKVRERTFKYSDQKLFDPGQEVEVWMGYYGEKRQRLMLKGEITSLRPTFPASGASTLAVSGLNLLHRLRRKQRTDSYKKLTDSQIAKRIADRLQLKLECKRTPASETRYAYLFQDNQYDIVFLMERARRIGYDLYVKEAGENGRSEKSTLFFTPSGDERATYELVYGASLIQFTPNLTTANQVGKVTVRGWNPRQKKKIEYTAKREELRTKGTGKRGRQADLEKSFGDREEVITSIPVESPDEAKRLAIETLERISKDIIKGSGSTVGLPDLRAGNVVQIEGLGERFSGRYFVTATTHTIDDSGYTTQFECRREEKK